MVAPGKTQSVGGLSFQNYGSHHNAYPHVYFTAAAAIGGSEEEVTEFCARLHKTLSEAVARQYKAVAAVQRQRQPVQVQDQAVQGQGVEAVQTQAVQPVPEQ